MSWIFGCILAHPSSVPPAVRPAALPDPLQPTHSRTFLERNEQGVYASDVRPVPWRAACLLPHEPGAIGKAWVGALCARAGLPGGEGNDGRGRCLALGAERVGTVQAARVSVATGTDATKYTSYSPISLVSVSFSS